MHIKNKESSYYEGELPTKRAFLMMRITGTPSWCLLSMLAFILYKFMHLTPFQITVLIALKPTSSLLSPYWSQAIHQRPDRIITNLIGANLIRHLPFLFVPWFHTPWFMIISFGIYMTLTRATIPGWMELFKHTLPKEKRASMVGFGTTIDFLGAALLTVGMGILLDHYPGIWTWLFFASALIGILSTFLLTSIPFTPFAQGGAPVPPRLREKALKPWKEVWNLVLERKDFTFFQVGFMFGGAGLMIMQPALPKFFIDTLHLSFTKMGVAIALCKAVGVALTSPLWTRLFQKINLFKLSALVTFFAFLFPFFLFASSFHLYMLYFAYALYGVMQAGSELSWHMSGLVFAREKDSSVYSMTNVLTVGIRGCIIPALGSALLISFNPGTVILLGALFCLVATLSFFLYSRAVTFKEQTIIE